MNKNGKILQEPEVSSGGMSIRNSKSFTSVLSGVCYRLYIQRAKLLGVVSKPKPAASWPVFSQLATEGHACSSLQGWEQGQLLFGRDSFPLLSAASSLPRSPCGGAVLAASPGALHGPAGDGPRLLSARTLLLPRAFGCQKQQGTLPWPCWCSLSVQLAGKAVTRVQVVNLP